MAGDLPGSMQRPQTGVENVERCSDGGGVLATGVRVTAVRWHRNAPCAVVDAPCAVAGSQHGSPDAAIVMAFIPISGNTRDYNRLHFPSRTHNDSKNTPSTTPSPFIATSEAAHRTPAPRCAP